MKKTVSAIFLLIVSFQLSFSKNIDKINTLYSNAITEWNSSSKKALPYFEDLFFEIYPYYNKYYTYEIDSQSFGVLHMMSRQYTRFMYNYSYIGLGRKEHIEKGWKMLQSVKSHYMKKDFNTIQFHIMNNNEVSHLIENTNLCNYNSLITLNNTIKNKVSDILFLDPPSISDVQKNLNEDELYLSFSSSINIRSLYIVAITKTQVKVYKTTKSVTEIYNRTARFKSWLEGDEDLEFHTSITLSNIDDSKTEKHKKDIEVLENELNLILKNYKQTKLYLENDIFISQIPFDILNSWDKKPFFQKFQIKHIPNADFFIYSKTKKSNQSGTILAISPLSNDDEYLVDETNQIENLNLQVENKSAITYNEFLSLIRSNQSYDIIHLSSHFNREKVISVESESFQVGSQTIFPQNYSSTQAYLTFDNKKISPNQILINNKTNTNTLILSGCETANADDIYKVLYPKAFGFDVSKEEKEQKKDAIKLNLDLIYYSQGGCYCESATSFDNLLRLAMAFKPKNIIALQNIASQNYLKLFFKEFYINIENGMDVENAFFKTKKDLMALEDDGYYHYASIIYIGT